MSGRLTMAVNAERPNLDLEESRSGRMDDLSLDGGGGN